MSTNRDALDPYARTAQIFPTLDEDMLARLMPYGVEGEVPPGGVLFRRGDRRTDFFVILEGEVAILRDDAHQITVHRAGGFTGELDHVSARAALVDARAVGLTRVLRIADADLRRAMAAEPDIGEIVMRAFILRRMGFIQHGQSGLVLLGRDNDGDTLRIERFVIRNGYPFRIIDGARDPEARPLLDEYGISLDDLPVVIAPDGSVLFNPTTPELADRLGMTEQFDPEEMWDVAVVGAGPAGLAAATYAASEGLKTVVIEGFAPGGQAGTSSKIENYLGFPTGISGQALAGRAQIQAQKFGARIAVSRMAARLECETLPYRLSLEDGQTLFARAIVIASGARYRRLDVPGYSRLEGHGIHYAATAMEASLCAGQEVVVVGGGNSAGQAAMYLSRHVAHVHVLVRGSGLAATMSQYLIQRIDLSPRVTLHPHSAVVRVEGERALQTIVWANVRSGAETRLTSGALFVMIGAEPNTDWLSGCLPLDEKGFVVTGSAGSPYATDRPGIYAVGDVRAGSVKRVAAGVGEGSVVVQAIHGYLEQLAAASTIDSHEVTAPMRPTSTERVAS